uniref:Odorant-binding protein 3 n=1 Tax=Oedaleus infernalis TaxID=267432 RepID=A0A385I8C5_9ORTH|nr:odorant-binding protein 3 [Oedaleus infernalis]
MRTILTVAVSVMLLVAPSKTHEPDFTKGISDVKVCMASENLDSLDGLKANKEARTAEEKCFIGCLMKFVEVLNSDGQYDVALFKEHINRSPDLAMDQQKKAALLEVADSCAGKASACSGHCECGAVVANCLAEGMEAKGEETIYDLLEKIFAKMDA